MNIFLFQIDSFATWKWDTKISYMDAGGLHKLPQSSAAPSRSSVTPLRHLPSSHEGGSSLDPSTTGVTVTAWADARGPEVGGDLRSCVVLLPAECAEGGCERCLVYEVFADESVQVSWDLHCHAHLPLKLL